MQPPSGLRQEKGSPVPISNPFREAPECVSLSRSTMNAGKIPWKARCSGNPRSLVRPAYRTISAHSSCHLRRTAPSARAAFHPTPRICTISRPRAAVLDGIAGLWSTNPGHNRDPIVAAIKREAEQLDYAPALQFAHPKSSNWRAGSPRWPRATSIACSSAIQVRRRSIPRSRSPSPTTMCAARARHAPDRP